jgi:hypothetical protein
MSHAAQAVNGPAIGPNRAYLLASFAAPSQALSSLVDWPRKLCASPSVAIIVGA